MLTLILAASMAVAQPVIDEANVIPDDQEQALNQQLRKYAEDTPNRIVVVTVPNMNGMDVKDYANQRFRQIGIGNKQLNSGAMLLLAMKERKVRIEVGYGLEDTLTDGLTSRILAEDVVPKLKAGKPGDAMQAGVDDMISTLNANKPKTAEQLAQIEADNARIRQEIEDAVSTVMLTGLGGVSAFGLYWLVTSGKRRRKREQERLEREAREERERKEREEFYAQRSRIRMPVYVNNGGTGSSRPSKVTSRNSPTTPYTPTPSDGYSSDGFTSYSNRPSYTDDSSSSSSSSSDFDFGGGSSGGGGSDSDW